MYLGFPVSVPISLCPLGWTNVFLVHWKLLTSERVRARQHEPFSVHTPEYWQAPKMGEEYSVNKSPELDRVGELMDDARARANHRTFKNG
jgi:hypothetical protein